MVYHLHNLPSNIVGFNSIGKITKKDFSETIFPKVKQRIGKTDQLNYLLVHENMVKNFTVDAWLQEALISVKQLTNWKRAAIVSDSNAIRNFTTLFNCLMPGEFKGFEHKDMMKAIDWVAEKTD